jgi:integron integrase
LAEFYGYCDGRGLDGRDEGNLSLYLNSLVKRGKPDFQIAQARIAVLLSWEAVASAAPESDTAVQDVTREAELSAEWLAVLGRVEEEVRIRHYSPRTLKAYRVWSRAFARFSGLTPPGAVTADAARSFLAELAAKGVSAATQNQAFSALIFLFANVLRCPLEGLADTPRAPRRAILPEVLSRDEIRALLAGLRPPYKLFAQVLYGCGLRLSEGLGLRVRDIGLGAGSIRIMNTKGNKSRIVPLPRKLAPLLEAHLNLVRSRFEEDLRKGFSGAFLPRLLAGKLPGAVRDWSWQWVFPAPRLTIDSDDGGLWRNHMHESSVQKEIRRVSREVGLAKTVSPHTFRHSYATHLLQMGYDIRTVQDLLGHSDVSTTMIYTHIQQAISGRVMSPLDSLGPDQGVREPESGFTLDYTSAKNRAPCSRRDRDWEAPELPSGTWRIAAPGIRYLQKGALPGKTRRHRVESSLFGASSALLGTAKGRRGRMNSVSAAPEMEQDGNRKET